MMKKFLLLLICLLATTAAWANVVIFDPTVDAADVVIEPPYYMEKDGIRVMISNGMITETHYRVYKNQNITICSDECDIVKIEFQCLAQNDEKFGPGNFVVDVGSYSYEGYAGVWEGNAPCVTFTAAKNQVRITKIIVTYECDGVSMPDISPASGTYYQPIEVSMTCNTSDAVIYYTTNGDNPTTASTQYSAPFTLNQNATIKAIAVLDGEVSRVATATYEFVEASRIETLQDAINAEDGTVIYFPNPLTVLAQYANRLFVRDQTAYALIYGNCGQSYVTGDIIPGGVILTKSFFNGEPEFTDPKNFKPASGNVYVEPEEIDELVGHDMFGHYVVLHGVTIVQEGNQYFAIDLFGNKHPVYFGSMGVQAPANLSVTYDMYAVVGSYSKENTIYQLLPVKLVMNTLPITLCDMFGYPDDVPVIFDHEAYVIYQYNRYLYLMDECGYGVVYGDVNQVYSTGDVIPPGWGGTKTTWNGEPEIKNPTGFQAATRNEIPTPMLITLPQVGHQLWAHYVEIRDVYIDQENMLVRDKDGNTCPYYPQLPYEVDPTKPCDILAIITSYGRTEIIYQLFIINIPSIIPPPPGVCCLADLYENYYNGQSALFTCPLTAIYQNGSYLYVKDSCDDYGLMYSNNAGGPFENGDQIIGGAKWTTYQDAYQLIPTGNWEIVGNTDPVEPIELPIEEISQSMVHWYVRIPNVTFTNDDISPLIQDETGEMVVFDRFDAPVLYYWPDCDLNMDNEINIADINALIQVILYGLPDNYNTSTLNELPYPGKPYDVEGFIEIYRGRLQIIPTKISSHVRPPRPPRERFDVNEDGEINIADLNCLIDIILRYY